MYIHGGNIYTYIYIYTLNYTFLVFYDLFLVGCLLHKAMCVEYDPSCLLFEEGSGIRPSEKKTYFLILPLRLHKIGRSS